MKAKTKKAKPKRLLSLFLALVMVLGMFPAMSITASAYSGTGTEENPYIVTDYEELRSVMLNAPENFKTRYIKLGADVSNDKNEDGIGLLLTYGQCVDLDLNGYDISRIGISNDNIFSAMNGAKLTIRDSVGDGTVTSKLSGDRMTAVLYCYRNGEIIVEGGTFKSSYGTAVLVEGYVTINGGTFIANKEHTIIVNDTDYGLLSMNGGHISNNGYNNYSIFLSVECKAKLCALTADAKIYSYSSTNFHNFIPESSALTKGYFEYNYSILPDEKTGLIEIVKSSTVFIDAASVTVTDPKSGQAPDMEINNITVGGSTYTVDKITWYNGGTVDNPGTKMTSNEKFEGGQTYIVDVHVQPTGDYVIQNGCTVTINGVSTDKVFYRDGITGAGNYRVALTAQSAVNITGMGADVTGFELLNSYFEVEATPLDSSKYTIRDITWSDCHLTDDSPIITDSSMFEAGETWQLKLWFKPAAGYSISNPDTLPVTIAGQTATYVGTDGDYYGYKIEKTFSKYLHDYIDLSMDAPTSGMTPAEYAETIKIKNNDRFPYNNFEIGKVQCYRADWNDFSTFAAGTTYFITVEIDLKDDTSFEFAHYDSDITALVNGTPVEDYVVVDADSTWESNFNTYGGVQLNYQVYFTAKGEPMVSPVTGLKITPASSSSLTLSWDKNDSATGYIIQQYKNGTWTHVRQLARNTVTSYTATGLAPSTTYQYRVRAYYTNGSTTTYSSYTTISGITKPSNMTGLKATSTSSSVTFSWDKNDTATGYLIQQYKNGEWTHIRQLARNNVLSYTATGLAPSTIYQFRIRAYYTNGSSTTYGDYTTFRAMTKPSNMTGLKATSTSSSVTFSWDKNDTATGYLIQQYKDGAWTHVRQLARNTATTYTATGLAPSTIYQFRIRAYYTNGSSTTYSDYTTFRAMTKPSNMTGVKATSTANSVTISWDKNDTATGYFVQQYKDGAWTHVRQLARNTATTYTATGLTPSTTYQYRIRAYYTDGTSTTYSDYTQTLTVTTKA